MSIYILGTITIACMTYIFRDILLFHFGSVYKVAMFQVGILVFWPLLICGATLILALAVLWHVGKLILNIIVTKG